jgi:hypothetical protein
MEPSGCNRSQSVANEPVARTAQTSEKFAVGCDQLPESFHGKEGVDGSSPLEGSAKAPEIGAFSSRSTRRASIKPWVWSRLWSLQVHEPQVITRESALIGAMGSAEPARRHAPGPRPTQALWQGGGGRPRRLNTGRVRADVRTGVPRRERRAGPPWIKSR